MTVRSSSCACSYWKWAIEDFEEDEELIGYVLTFVCCFFYGDGVVNFFLRGVDLLGFIFSSIDFSWASIFSLGGL